MDHEEIILMFNDSKALLEGHFELSSGLHSDKYCQCALVLQYPQFAEKLSAALARLFDSVEITCVIGPALGGVTLAYEVARQLGVKGIFAERKDGTMQLRRGFSVNDADKVLVVEDVITTGGSVKEVIALLQSMGKHVVGVGSLIDRSKKEIDFGVPFYALLKLPVAAFDPNECPMCKSGSEAVKPGSKKKN